MALLAVIVALAAAACVAAYPGVAKVRVQADTPDITLNEVQVFPCGSSTNVALNKPITTSAFGGGCSSTMDERPPSLVNDGLTWRKFRRHILHER